MIGMSGEDGTRPIKLFEQHDTDELVRPSRLAEGEPHFGASAETGGQSVGTADDKTDGGTILTAPLAQRAGKCGAVEAFATLVEQHDHRPIRDDVGEGDRFLDTAALGVLRPAFANFDDLKVAQPKRTARGRGTLAISFGKHALRPLLEATDGGDDNAH